MPRLLHTAPAPPDAVGARAVLARLVASVRAPLGRSVPRVDVGADFHLERFARALEAALAPDRASGTDPRGAPALASGDPGPTVVRVDLRDVARAERQGLHWCPEIQALLDAPAEGPAVAVLLSGLGACTPEEHEDILALLGRRSLGGRQSGGERELPARVRLAVLHERSRSRLPLGTTLRLADPWTVDLAAEEDLPFRDPAYAERVAQVEAMLGAIQRARVSDPALLLQHVNDVIAMTFAPGVRLDPVRPAVDDVALVDGELVAQGPVRAVPEHLQSEDPGPVDVPPLTVPVGGSPANRRAGSATAAAVARPAVATRPAGHPRAANRSRARRGE